MARRHVKTIAIRGFLSRTKYLVGMRAHVPVGKPRPGMEHVRKPQLRPQVSPSRNSGVRSSNDPFHEEIRVSFTITWRLIIYAGRYIRPLVDACDVRSDCISPERFVLVVHVVPGHVAHRRSKFVRRKSAIQVKRTRCPLRRNRSISLSLSGQMGLNFPRRSRRSAARDERNHTVGRCVSMYTFGICRSAINMSTANETRRAGGRGCWTKLFSPWTFV